MEGYLNYSPSDIMTILIFGSLFFIFAYGSAFAVYIKGMGEVKQHQTSLSNVIVKAILFQLVAILFVFVIIGILDIQSRIGQMSNVNFSEATASFFSVDWANLDMNKLANYYEIKNKKMEGLGLFILIKALWSVFGLLIVFAPIVIVYMILHTVLIKHKENRGGGLFEVLTDFFTTLIFTFILFTVHLSMPFMILTNMYKMNEDKIVKRVGDKNMLIGLTYSNRAGSFIRHSLDEVTKKAIELKKNN